MWIAVDSSNPTPFLKYLFSNTRGGNARRRCGGGVTCLFSDYRSLMHKFWAVRKGGGIVVTSYNLFYR